MDERRLLAVLAHPDDESFAIGGTLARYAKTGARATVLTATRGEAARGGGDRNRMAAIRERELRRAVRVLGVNELRILDYKDGRLAGADRARLVSDLVTLLEELHPQVVITFGPDGISGHPDHVAIGEATNRAFGLIGQAACAEEPMNGDRTLQRPLRLFYIAPSPATRQCCRKGNANFSPSGLTAVDIVAFREAKVRAMQCHASQPQPFPGAPEVEARRLHGWEYFRVVRPAGAASPADDLFKGLP